MKYHLLYQIINKLNGKKYVGVHSTNEIDDGYMGSSVTLTEDIMVHGTDHFEKTILAVCATRKLANMFEFAVIGSDDITTDDYNIVGNIDFDCDKRFAFNEAYDFAPSGTYIEQHYGIPARVTRHWAKKHGNFKDCQSLINSMLKGGRIKPDGNGKYTFVSLRNDLEPITKKERSRITYLINKAKAGKIKNKTASAKILAMATKSKSNREILKLDEEFKRRGEKL